MAMMTGHAVITPAQRFESQQTTHVASRSDGRYRPVGAAKQQIRR